MRITQNMMTRNYLRQMNSNLARYNKSMERMSGQKYSKASENVSDTSRALRVRQSIYDNEQYLVNIRDANGRLSSAESSLMSVNDILVTAREQLLKKSLNDANAGEREIIAQQMDSMREEILQFVNAEFSGGYLFGGTENGQAPFDVNSNGQLTYNGIEVSGIFEEDGKHYYYATPGDVTTKTLVPESGDAYIDVGLGLTLTGDQVESRSAFKITFSGLDILGFGSTADGKSLNLFNMLQDAADLLRADTFDRAALDDLSERIKSQTEAMMLQVTDIGAKSDFLEKTEERLTNDNYNLTVLQQKLEVSDTAEESMNWKMYSAVMMATYQFGAHVLPVSLMDFIQ